MSRKTQTKRKSSSKAKVRSKRATKRKPASGSSAAAKSSAKKPATKKSTTRKTSAKKSASKRSPAKKASDRSLAARAKASGPIEMAGAMIHEQRLDNGLQVLIAERHADPVVAVMLYYRVGSKDERGREAGISHFLEHMMFKGTPVYGKGMLDRTTTSLGGQNNAFTGNDHTAYWYEFASDRWETALALESDRMKHLLLEPSEFDAEREVVLEELSMGEDEPWRVLARRVEQRLFDRHPYGRPIIGFIDSLRGMTPEDMREYHRRFYQPGNALLIVAGDVDPAEARERVEAHFGEIPAETDRDAGAELLPPLEEPFGEQRLEMNWPDRASRLMILWRTEPAGTLADTALDLAMTILTSGRNARLQRDLVLDRGLATSVSASNDTRVESGAFWLMAEAAEGVEPEALEAALLEHIERLATELVSPKELTRARQILLASEAHDAETTSDLAEEIGGWGIDIDWRLAFDGGARHEAVEPSDLRETVARLLSRSRRVVGWCLPAESEEEAPASARAASAKRAPRAKAAGKRASAKKATQKRAVAKKSASKKSPARKSTTKKSTSKRSSARKSTAKKSSARKSSSRKATTKRGGGQ